MTNAMIVLHESVKLMEEGILQGTGRMITVENADGTKQQLEMPEEIHTFSAWKELGYKIKKGEKAIAKFPIWKHTTKTVTDEDTKEEKERSAMYMKTAAFFKMAQVEKIEEKGVK